MIEYLNYCEYSKLYSFEIRSVHYKIGSGFLEKVYENAATIELKHRNIPFERQKIYKVFYRGELAGECKADIVVDDKIIIEAKAVKELNNIMTA